MFIYFACLVIFWGMVVRSLSAAKTKNKAQIVFASLLFCLIAGLRYQTGFDWIDYELALTRAHIMSLASYTYISFRMEPLFFLFLKLIDALRGNLQAVFFLTAIINTAVIVFFSRTFKINILYIFAICFSWNYLSLQMALTRQSLAMSMLLLVLIFWKEKKYSLMFLAFLAAVGFHFSALLFIPIFVPFYYHNIYKYRFYLLSALFFLAVFQVDLSHYVFFVAAKILSGGLQEKIYNYSLGLRKINSTSAVLFIFLNMFLTFVLARRINSKDIFQKVFFGILFYLLSSQILMRGFPTFWHRIDYFSINTTAALLFLTWVEKPYRERLYELAAISFVSSVVFLFLLIRPIMIPYYPYYSYPQYLISGKEGDGRARLMKINEEASRKLEKERSQAN